ncbi:MAG: fimbria/pilus periplasmic chaperone [Symbiopectobacterium sp.]|uniref:fimbria/pilus periplasmic chaperone n=1 Tax=Symbiopectobacterium sp. TaxID=2952789 RepID=UPI0039E8990A
MVCALWLMGSVPAFGVVNIEGTRVILHDGEMSTSLILSNSEKQPTLVQVWSDDGDPLTPPERATTSLIAVPPVFSMKPGEARSLRLLLTSRQGVANDKESLLWLNVYQISPNTAEMTRHTQNVVLPLRLRLKVFIRPAGLGDPNESDGEQLRFRLLQGRDGAQLQVTNPTPWHMTLTDISYAEQRLGSMMVAPTSSVNLLINRAIVGQALSYQPINDLGTHWRYSTTLNL